MAYLRTISPKCAYPRCQDTPTLELVTKSGGTFGPYCEEHGRIALGDLNKSEHRG